METKLTVLLAKTDHLAGSYKKGFEEYVKFFKGSQGAFVGEKRTYTPLPGTIDEPTKRSNKLVVTTVEEKLKYLESAAADYIDAAFSLERTNGNQSNTVVLVVDNVNFGRFTALELLRLKSLLEFGTLKEMYENIPVRNDDENWKRTTNEMYVGRDIHESELISGTAKTTVKEAYILTDPNLSKLGDGAKYDPKIATKDTVMELGEYTTQKFTGMLSHRQRAEILARRSRLLTAVISALKEVNDVVAIPSDMTAEKLFNYLHNGVG